MEIFLGMSWLQHQAFVVTSASNGGFNIGDEGTKGAIGLAVGLLTGYIIDLIKRRREPSKRLSYDAWTEATLLEAPREMQERVSISFDGARVEDLSVLQCVIENTGNSVVKNQFVRFDLGPKAEVLHRELKPKPDPELGVETAQRPGTPPHDPDYKIAHLERGHTVGFQFVVTGARPDWRLVPFNEEGGVNFVPRSAERAIDDAEHLAPFTFWVVLLLFLPPAFDLLFTLSNPIEAVARIVLIFLLAPHLAPSTRVIARAIERAAASSRQATISVTGDNVVVARSDGGDVVMQDVSIRGPSESEDIPTH